MPETEDEGVRVAVCEPVADEEKDGVRVPLEEKLPLCVELELSVGETDTVGESEAHPEPDTVGECDAHTVGVCEPVPHVDAESDRVVLEEKLPLDVGHVLSEGEADTDGESEVHPEADTVGVCEALAVGVCEADPHTEADCDRVPLGV